MKPTSSVFSWTLTATLTEPLSPDEARPGLFLWSSSSIYFGHTPALRPLQPAVFSLVGRYSTNWPALTAGLTISILPILIVYVLMQRQFVAGLTAGAIKG